MAVNPSSPMHQIAGMLPGIFVLFVGVIIAVGTTAYAAWICNFVSYSCPSGGCGDLPANFCATGVTIMLGSMLLAGPLIAIGSTMLIVPKAR